LRPGDLTRVRTFSKRLDGRSKSQRTPCKRLASNARRAAHALK
jgi:hypothetical protein